MKTSLAIVLAAAAALMVSATVDAAIAGYSNKSPGLCGAVACPIQTRPPDPWAQAHIAVRCERYTSQPLPVPEAGWSSLEVMEPRNAEVHDR
jgi:hypothetical protein